MKFFHQFQEDVEKLRQDLEAIRKKDAPVERLKQRRSAAQKSSEDESSQENPTEIVRQNIEKQHQANVKSGQENKSKAQETKERGKQRAAVVGAAVRSGIKQAAYAGASGAASLINRIRKLKRG